MPRFRRKKRKEKPFRRGSVIKPKHEPQKRKRTGLFTDEQGRIRRIDPQQPRRGTPGDLVRWVGRHAGRFGSNLAKGLEATSKSTLSLPRIQHRGASQPRTPEIIEAEMVTPPIGAMQEQVEQEIRQTRPIGLPHIVDKEDVISPSQEGDLQKYVKEAMQHMPIGTDTSVEPTVTVVPRDQFKTHMQTRGAPHPNIPAMTPSKNQIIVSDALFDMSEKERRAIMLHEAYHAFRGHAEAQAQAGHPLDWTEREARDFEASLEPEGSHAAVQRLFGGTPSLGGLLGAFRTPGQ